jgi:hypothetical protein
LQRSFRTAKANPTCRMMMFHGIASMWMESDLPSALPVQKLLEASKVGIGSDAG